MSDTTPLVTKADLAALEARVIGAIEESSRSTRLDRIEHAVAGHIEQARRDYEENRRIQRDSQTDRDAIWKRMEERDREYRALMKERDEAYRALMAERDKAADERVQKLVSSIGALIRQMGGQS